MTISMFEIAEMTELNKQVYQIIDDGHPGKKFVIVEVSEWQEFETWKTTKELTKTMLTPSFAGLPIESLDTEHPK